MVRVEWLSLHSGDRSDGRGVFAAYSSLCVVGVLLRVCCSPGVSSGHD